MNLFKINIKIDKIELIGIKENFQIKIRNSNQINKKIV